MLPTEHNIHNTYYPVSTIHRQRQIHFKSFRMFINFLLLLALSIPALSIPRIDRSLEKRHSYPWVGCFELDDTECHHGVFNKSWPRPEIRDLYDCHFFEHTTQRIGMCTSQTPPYVLVAQITIVSSPVGT